MGLRPILRPSPDICPCNFTGLMAQKTQLALDLHLKLPLGLHHGPSGTSRPPSCILE